MRLCYQVATPDVAVAPSVTAFQGPLAESLGRLGDLGYDGVEFMTLDPGRLDRDAVAGLLEKNRLAAVLVCTGEIFGQLGLSFMDPDAASRAEAVRRTREIIDFAAFLGANINVGRLRGQFREDVDRDVSYRWAVEALREVSEYAGEHGVRVALENVTYLQTNFVNTIDDAAGVVADVGLPSFGFMMDIFHMNIEEKDMYRAIAEHGGKTFHVHLADNNRRYPGHCGFDFEKIVGAFKAAGYAGDFAAEIYQIPDQDTAAAKTAEHLRPILAKAYA